MLCNDQHVWCGVMSHFCDVDCGVMQGVMWCVMQCGMWCNITIESCAICAAVMWREVVHDVECDAMNKMRSDARCFCDMEWCDVEWCGMCYNVTAPCFATSHHHMVLWYGMVHDVVWCNVEWNMGCYNVTAPCFATSHHHSSIIPHLTAPHSTSLHVT